MSSISDPLPAVDRMQSANLELLRSFVVLGETGHFGRAASRLHLSQPSLTKQIRRLEDLLGAPLFDRSRQGTALTPFGRRFLTEVRPLLHHADEIWQSGVREARGERGHLGVGFNLSVVDIMASLLPRFQARYPNVTFTLDDAPSHDQVEKIRSGELDVGFLRLPVGHGLDARRLTEDSLVLAIPRDWSDTIDGLNNALPLGATFILLRTELSPDLSKRIERLFSERNFTPASIHRVNTIWTLVALVSAGIGVALIHKSAIAALAADTGSIAIRALPDPDLSWDVGVAWRADRTNPALTRFLQMIR
ncbi:LysR family transcriptional regulator [Gluconacetobacter sp. Hr-1-5]|uniref:LysR family transcriptional regulator n=1 Tax=Gluconacetobacter sp. Hr-1-5 TaxID=3395370 RepID=UPI003B51FE15